jgi:hypothetical protein
MSAREAGGRDTGDMIGRRVWFIALSPLECRLFEAGQGYDAIVQVYIV